MNFYNYLLNCPNICTKFSESLLHQANKFAFIIYCWAGIYKSQYYKAITCVFTTKLISKFHAIAKCKQYLNYRKEHKLNLIRLNYCMWHH